MSSNAARAYRQLSAHGASPVGLIVLLYEAAVSSLHRAIQALETNDIERRTHHLNHAIAVIGELQASLDFSQGGDVARNLDQFYRIARSRILEASAGKSKTILKQLAAQFLSLREAWEHVDAPLTGPPAPPVVVNRAASH